MLMVGEIMCGGWQGVYGNSPYFLLNFSMNIFNVYLKGKNNTITIRKTSDFAGFRHYSEDSKGTGIFEKGNKIFKPRKGMALGDLYACEGQRLQA